jgi:hypothetical protein
VAASGHREISNCCSSPGLTVPSGRRRVERNSLEDSGTPPYLPRFGRPRFTHRASLSLLDSSRLQAPLLIQSYARRALFLTCEEMQ